MGPSVVDEDQVSNTTSTMSTVTAYSVATPTNSFKALVVSECDIHILDGNLHLLELNGNLFLGGDSLGYGIEYLVNHLYFYWLLVEWIFGNNFSGRSLK